MIFKYLFIILVRINIGNYLYIFIVAPQQAIQQRLSLWSTYGIHAFNNKFFWYPIAAIEGSSAKWPKHWSKHNMIDNTMFRRARIVRIEGMVNPMATVQWSDGDHPTALRLVKLNLNWWLHPWRAVVIWIREYRRFVKKEINIGSYMRTRSLTHL